jgi:uncharacterized membrane protein
MGFFTQGEAHTRSILKAVSWRVTGSIDTFVISLLITGKIGLAGAIASVEVITKTALYYFHERVWAPSLGEDKAASSDFRRLPST